MAYGLKYYGYFASTDYIQSREYKIEILVNGYIGGASEFTCGSSAFVEKSKSTADSPMGIMDARYTIKIISDTLTIQDFYTEENLSHKIKLIDITNIVVPKTLDIEVS